MVFVESSMRTPVVSTIPGAWGQPGIWSVVTGNGPEDAQAGCTLLHRNPIRSMMHGMSMKNLFFPVFIAASPLQNGFELRFVYFFQTRDS